MGLETATFISGLDATNPTAVDGVGQGDDHIRLIKAALKGTFPNITGAITATQAQLNSPFPMGGIIVWYGTVAGVPAGWAICDGSTYTRTDGGGNIVSPDLRNRFLIGAGAVAPTYNLPGSAGGSFTQNSTAAGAFSGTFGSASAGSHSHTGFTGDTSLTAAQIPPHSHEVAAHDSRIGGNPNGGLVRINGDDLGGSNQYVLSPGGNPLNGAYLSGVTGGGATHNHFLLPDGAHTHTTAVAIPDHFHTTPVLPPYYALLYLMKI